MSSPLTTNQINQIMNIPDKSSSSSSTFKPAASSLGSPSKKWKWGPRNSTRKPRQGKPGSKRYQRWLNASYLMDLEADLEISDFTVEPPSSMFQTVFDDDEFYTMWCPFIETTEEYELEMLSYFEKPQSCKVSSDPLTPEQSYRKIHRETRRLLHKYVETEFLNDLDNEISSFVFDCTAVHELSFQIDNPFHRLLCYGICQYYSLHTKSIPVLASEQEKIVYISKPKYTFAPPHSSLCTFLRSMPTC